MKFNFLNVFGALALFATSASFGSAVEFTGTAKPVSASGINLSVYPTAKLAAVGAELPLTGYGIRQKEIFLGLKANVYVAASYAKIATPAKPIEALANQPKVIQLTLLRNLSGDEIRASFEEALDKNGVDLNGTAIQNVFSQFQMNLKAGQTVTLIGYPNATGSLEKLIVEVPGKTITEEGKDLATDFWKIWFGVPVDAEMGKLKAELLK